MSLPETFKGYPVKGRTDKAVPGSDRYAELTKAIMEWNQASLGTGQNMAQCQNVAQELTIERDHGLIVWINRRTA